MARFTAEEPIASALDMAPEFRAAIVDPEVQARAFNDALFALLQEVVEADSERLIKAYPVAAVVVAASEDSVDLTDDGGTPPDGGPGTLEWLIIEYIDYGDMHGPIDEVTILGVSDRNAAAEYEGQVVALLNDQYEQLDKLAGWDGVETLTVWGVQAPARVTGRTLGTTTFRYPRVLQNAVKWDLVCWMAAHIGIKDVRVGRWDAMAGAAREALGIEATRPISGRIEQITPSGR